MYDIEKKDLLKKAILRLVMLHEPISRKCLQEHLHVRLATITDITKELIDEEYIIESGNIPGSDGGLKKTLCINRSFYRFIGINVSKEQLFAVVINLAGEVINRMNKPIDATLSVDAFMDIVSSIVSDVRDGDEKVRLIGIGIAFAAALNLERTKILSSSNNSKFEKVEMKKILSDRFGLPVFLETSNNAYILAEEWFGYIKDVSNALYVEVGENIAAGIIIGGNVVRGVFGIEGELGHTVVERNGKLCTCGNRGCLETVASGKVIKSKLVDMLNKGASSAVTEIADGDLDNLSVSVLYQAAQRGDKLTITLLDEAAEYIGLAVANMINIVGPGVVVFGGEGITPEGVYTRMLIEKTKKNLFEWVTRESGVKFFVSEFGIWGAAVGGATLGLMDFYKIEQLMPFGIS